jgi:hypothetical protein
MTYVHCHGCGAPVQVGAPCRHCARGRTHAALHEAYLEGRKPWEMREVVASVRRAEQRVS